MVLWDRPRRLLRPSPSRGGARSVEFGMGREKRSIARTHNCLANSVTIGSPTRGAHGAVSPSRRASASGTPTDRLRTAPPRSVQSHGETQGGSDRALGPDTKTDVLLDTRLLRLRSCKKQLGQGGVISHNGVHPTYRGIRRGSPQLARAHERRVESGRRSHAQVRHELVKRRRAAGLSGGGAGPESTQTAGAIGLPVGPGLPGDVLHAMRGRLLR